MYLKTILFLIIIKTPKTFVYFVFLMVKIVIRPQSLTGTLTENGIDSPDSSETIFLI